MPRSEAAEGPADHLTTYLAAGSAMLIKTAAAKGKPITGLKSKHTAGRELNPVASRHLSRHLLCLSTGRLELKASWSLAVAPPCQRDALPS